MDEDASLYQVRSEADKRRQPRHVPHLQAIDGWLKHWGIAHPYTLSDDQYDFLVRSVPAFLAVCRGFPADLRDETFCFRLTSVSKVVNHTADHRLKKRYTNLRNWRFVHDDYVRDSTWLPLSRYVEGQLSSARRFTWWTTLNSEAWKTPAGAVSAAHRLGIPNDWVVPSHALVLRCPASYLSQNQMVFVPTVVDAFDSRIFHPTSDDDHPRRGVTIDLSIPNHLQEGASEVVAKEIPVEELECIPLRISDEEKKQNPVFLHDIMSLLLTYYRNL